MVLESGDTSPAFLELFFTALNLAFLELAIAQQLVDLIGQNSPLARESLDLTSALSDARFEIGTTILELPLLRLKPFDGRTQLTDARLQRTALTLVGGQQLLLGREGDLGVVENLARRITAVPQVFQAPAQLSDLGGRVQFTLFPFGHLGGERFPLLNIARFLAGEGLEIAIYLSQPNLQRTLGRLKRIELTLTGRHGDFLLAQFDPNFFETHLKGGLFGLKGALLATGLSNAFLQHCDLRLEFRDLVLASQDARRRFAGCALSTAREHAQPIEDLAGGSDKVPASPGAGRQGLGHRQVGHDERATQQTGHQGRHRGFGFHHRQRQNRAIRQRCGWLDRSRCQQRQRRDAGTALPIGGQIGQNFRSGRGLLSEDNLQVVAQGGFHGQDVGIGHLESVGQGSEDMLALLERREGPGSETLVLSGQLLEHSQLRTLFRLLPQQGVALLGRLHDLGLKRLQALLTLFQGHPGRLHLHPLRLHLLGKFDSLHFQPDALFFELNLLGIELLQPHHVALELEGQLVDLIANTPQPLRR